VEVKLFLGSPVQVQYIQSSGVFHIVDLCFLKSKKMTLCKMDIPIHVSS
jgi:hypothetical protein